MKVAGLQPRLIPLNQDSLLPDFSRLDATAVAGCTCLLLNYPNNPTGVTVDYQFWQQVLLFCQQHDLLLIHDNPYVGQVSTYICADPDCYCCSCDAIITGSRQQPAISEVSRRYTNPVYGHLGCQLSKPVMASSGLITPLTLQQD